MSIHFLSWYVSSLSSTLNPSSGKSAPFSRLIRCSLIFSISRVSWSYWVAYSLASSSAFSLSKFALTFRLVSSISARFFSSSSVDWSIKSNASVLAIVKSLVALFNSSSLACNCFFNAATSSLKIDTLYSIWVTLSRLRWFSPFFANIACCWLISSWGEIKSFGTFS